MPGFMAVNIPNRSEKSNAIQRCEKHGKQWPKSGY